MAFVGWASLASVLALLGVKLALKSDAKQGTATAVIKPAMNRLFLKNVNAKSAERNDVITGVLVFLNVKNDNVYLILGNNAHNTVRYY